MDVPSVASRVSTFVVSMTLMTTFALDRMIASRRTISRFRLFNIPCNQFTDEQATPSLRIEMFGSSE